MNNKEMSKMEVNLLSYTPDALEIIYTAFRTCYAKLKPEQIWQEIKENKISREEIIKFIKNGLATGHESPLEHVSFTFVISGVSRALSHQLVRHRLASYSQQSQRYVQFKPGETDYVTPPTWHQAGLVDDLDELVRLTCQLYEKAISRGVPAEDARFVFLNAFCTNLTMTMNYRQLLHTADLRLCYQAQWEIRNLFVLIRQRVSEVYPELGRAISPQCGKGRLGYCPERLEKYKKCPLRTGCLHKRFYHKGFIIKVLS